MSNRCDNKLEIIGTEADIDQVFNYISSEGDDGEKDLFDFNKVKPVPGDLINIEHVKENVKHDAKNHFQLPDDELNIFIAGYPDADREVFKLMVNNLKKTGFADTNDWKNEHWGTRWAGEILIENNVIRFLTPWNPPLPVIEKLSAIFPGVKLSISYGGPEFDPFRYYNIIYKEGVKVYQKMEYDLEAEKKHNQESRLINSGLNSNDLKENNPNPFDKPEDLPF